jgi:hypothetical protein
MEEPAMTDRDDLVQRFVDQELSAEERIRFVAELGRDAALRERAVALEELLVETGHLEAPAVPPAFVAGVMERAGRGESVRRRLARVLWAPRALRWNLATAIGTACAAIAILAAALLVVRGPIGASKSAGGAGAERAASSPSAGAAVLVRLIVVHPGARTVQVAGDFNGWDPARTPLVHVSGDAWAATLPLEPGRYEYMFVVDGHQWVADPFAVEQSADGFGSHNAVLDVRTPGVAPS